MRVKVRGREERGEVKCEMREGKVWEKSVKVDCMILILE
jgi:hypothetical protein